VLTKVSELINPVSGDWDTQLIHEVFWEEDWNRILSIPIKPGMEDILAWHFDKKGVFSVKSAYHVLNDSKERDVCRQQGEESTGAGNQADGGFRWRRILKLNCPPKVKHFLCRFTLNSLLVRCNISRRGMDIDTRCPVCWRLDEDGGHCFLKCKFAKQCWRALNLEEERTRFVDMQSALQVTDHILSLPEEKKLLVVGLLWAWWEARNKANAGEERKSTNEVICRARLLTNLLPEVVTNDTGSAEGIRGTRWVPPSPNAWKINVDAAFWEKGFAGSLGFCNPRPSL